MRVLVTSPWMGVGGAERFAVQIVKGLSERGLEVGLAAGPGVLDGELSEVSHARFRVPPPSRSTAGLTRMFVALRRAIATFDPDVVHAQNVVHAALAGVAGRTAGRRRPPVLATFHGLNPGEFRVASRLLRAADAVACVSQDLLDGLLDAGYPARTAHLVHNSIAAVPPLTRERSEALDADLHLGAVRRGHRPPVVAIVGRLTHEKGHAQFLRAAAWIADRLPDVRFLVVGDGELRQELEALAQGLGVAEQVRFTGMRRDARNIIARADLLVFSSKWEGLSIAALEALSCGTPVVSTEVPGMRSLLSTGAGEVVRGGPEDLGKAVIDLLADDERRAAMGAVGRRLAAEEFSVPAMLDRYLGLYAELTGRPMPAARSGPRSITTTHDAGELPA